LLSLLASLSLSSPTWRAQRGSSSEDHQLNLTTTDGGRVLVSVWRCRPWLCVAVVWAAVIQRPLVPPFLAASVAPFPHTASPARGSRRSSSTKHSRIRGNHDQPFLTLPLRTFFSLRTKIRTCEDRKDYSRVCICTDLAPGRWPRPLRMLLFFVPGGGGCGIMLGGALLAEPSRL
jgi:hypothetical protein